MAGEFPVAAAVRSVTLGRAYAWAIRTLHDSTSRDPSEKADSAGNDPLNYALIISAKLSRAVFWIRRGGGLLLSTLDWVLIETWKDAGIPLEAGAARDRCRIRPL